MTKKKNILIAALAIVIYLLAQQGEKLSGPASDSPGTDNTIAVAFANEQSDLQIRGRGVVKKVLPDDTKGLKHQKFILQTSPDHTVLVAHNIDLADRLSGLRKGDTVEFYGEYEWTSRGGVMHWTHHDPSGRHIDGWLKYNGKTYQ
jgi:hypothetical protein